MRTNQCVYEVVVNVKKNGAGHYSSFLGMFVKKEMKRMFHITARTPEQASKKAEKYGRPLSVRKADVAKMYGDITKLRLDQKPLAGVYQFGNPYDSAIAMGEMIWKKKKRGKRIKNREKDKKGIDI